MNALEKLRVLDEHLQQERESAIDELRLEHTKTLREISELETAAFSALRSACAPLQRKLSEIEAVLLKSPPAMPVVPTVPAVTQQSFVGKPSAKRDVLALLYRAPEGLTARQLERLVGYSGRAGASVLKSNGFAVGAVNSSNLTVYTLSAKGRALFEADCLAEYRRRFEMTGGTTRVDRKRLVEKQSVLSDFPIQTKQPRVSISRTVLQLLSKNDAGMTFTQIKDLLGHPSACAASKMAHNPSKAVVTEIREGFKFYRITDIGRKRLR